MPVKGLVVTRNPLTGYHLRSKITCFEKCRRAEQVRIQYLPWYVVSSSFAKHGVDPFGLAVVDAWMVKAKALRPSTGKSYNTT